MPRSLVFAAMLFASSVLCAADYVPGKTNIVGHRGASYDAPENTVASFKLAWAQNADGAELDVYLTKDGRLAVLHDKDLKRTTGGASDIAVAKSTLDELRKFEVGSWKNEKYKGEQVPELADMLATVPSGKFVFVEVKCGPEIVPALDQALRDSKLKLEQTIVSSFNEKVVAEMKKVRPDVEAHWIVSLNKKDQTPPTAAQLIAKAREIKADGLHLSAGPTLNAAYLAELHAAGLKVVGWTVNDPKVAAELLENKVYGITTDRPGYIREQTSKH
ncbi:MAG: glycerophosphodiester phosphodiesterase [Pirellulales bacterium]